MLMMLLVSFSILSISSSSWIQSWLFMEMNLYTFLLIMKKTNQKSQDPTTTYFLVQALSSAALFASIISISNTNILQMNQTHLLMSLAILIKMGAAPFHSWVISCAPSMSFQSLCLMLTIQKIIPISIFSSTSTSKMMLISSILGAITTMMVSYKMSNTKSILGISSVNNMAWMTSIMSISQSISMAYLLIYSTTTWLATALLSKNNQNTVSMPNKNQASTSINILSMIGVPPLLGFFPKMITIMASIPSPINSMLILILIISSCYMAITYMMMIIPNLLMPHNSELTSTPNMTPMLNLLPIIMITLMN